MLNQIVYVRGEYILAMREGLRPDEEHPLDAHLGLHVVVAVRGDEVVLWPLLAPGEPIRLPKTAVWERPEGGRMKAEG